MTNRVALTTSETPLGTVEPKELSKVLPQEGNVEQIDTKKVEEGDVAEDFYENSYYDSEYTYDSQSTGGDGKENEPVEVNYQKRDKETG